MGAHFRRGNKGHIARGTRRLCTGAARGYTIIEVMLFLAVTGALMAGVLGSASVGVNTQRYADAVNTFTSVVQQEFTNTTNVINTQSVQSMCASVTSSTRGASDCVIIGRLLTVDNQGAIVKSNLIGVAPDSTDDDATDLEIIKQYMGDSRPIIDTTSQEKSDMSWGAKLQRGNPPAETFASVLIVRSPRSGNVYSYVIHSTSSVISSDNQLRDAVDQLLGDPAANSRNQYLCVDRSGWVVSPVRAVKIAPYASGPSGVSNVTASGTDCA